jgi:hypothetical protein
MQLEEGSVAHPVELELMDKDQNTELSSLELELQELQSRLQRLSDSIQSLRMIYAADPNPRLKSEERALRREYESTTEEIHSKLLQMQELEESQYDPW